MAAIIETVTYDAAPYLKHVVIRAKFSRGSRARIWLAARMMHLVGWIAGTTVEVSTDGEG